MSLLLVGCGYWGQNWAKTLHKINALGAICEANLELRETLQSQYPHVTFYQDLEGALQHPNLNGVVLATPASTHYCLSLQCVEYRLPVLIEKPMATTVEEAQHILAAARRQNVLVAVGHLLVYHPALIKLKCLIQQGELGDILTIHCTRAKMGKIRNEENVWLSFAPHDLSILIYLLGEPLEIVSVSPLNPLKRNGLEDGMIATFQTPSGKEASIFVSWLYPFKKMETIVVGSKKIAIFEDATTQEHKLKWMTYHLVEQGFGTERLIETLGTEALEPIDFTYQDPMETQALAFIQAILNPEQTDVPSLPNHGENGRQVVELLEQVNARATAQRQIFADLNNPQYCGWKGV